MSLYHLPACARVINSTSLIVFLYANDLSRVDANKILAIDFVNGIGQLFPVVVPPEYSSALISLVFSGLSR